MGKERDGQRMREELLTLKYSFGVIGGAVGKINLDRGRERLW